jgi:hypothetical protein
MIINMAVIVEGHSEVESVPVLIRRIAAEIDPSVFIDIKEPIRRPASKLKRPGELENAVELAARKIGGNGGVLILLDCDGYGECPKTDAPLLLSRAHASRSDIPVSVVLANKEYETWFIAAAESLRGKRRLSESLEIVADPENIRDAKGWLSHRMPQNDPYSEVNDQPALTGKFDMQSARRARSFDKCYREIAGMISALMSLQG